MSEMVERVAKALQKSFGPLGDERYYVRDEEAIEAARAAIEAAASYLDSIGRDQAAFTIRDPAPPRKRYQRI